MPRVKGGEHHGDAAIQNIEIGVKMFKEDKQLLYQGYLNEAADPSGIWRYRNAQTITRMTNTLAWLMAMGYDVSHLR